MEELELLSRETHESTDTRGESKKEKQARLRELQREFKDLLIHTDVASFGHDEETKHSLEECLPCFNILLTESKELPLIDEACVEAIWFLSRSLKRSLVPLSIRLACHTFLKQVALCLEEDRERPRRIGTPETYQDRLRRVLRAYLLAQGTEDTALQVERLCAELVFVDKELTEKDGKKRLRRDIIRTIYARGSDEHKSRLDEYIVRTFASSTRGNLRMDFLVKEFLRAKQFRLEGCLLQWARSGPLKEQPNIIFHNLVVMWSLEKLAPGSCHVLRDQFGIVNFMRYPFEILLNQFDERHDREKPYILLIAAHDDHNGAFHQESLLEALNALSKQLRGKARLRVIECGSRVELVRHLIRLDQTYHPRSSEHGQKIAHIIVHAHGDTKGVTWTWNRETKEESRLSDLETKIFQQCQRFFEDDATFVFNSCFVGKKRRFAQRLSAAYPQKTMIASNAKSSVRAYRARFPRNGKSSLDVDYHEGPYIKNVFRNGKQLS